MRKLKKKSYARLKKELDDVFSKYIRARDNYVCFTCGKQLTPQTSQAGHYISRTYLSTRWHEKNVNCQCYGCNIARKGNMSEYAYNLVKKYSINILEDLQVLKNTPVKIPSSKLEEDIEYWKRKLTNCSEFPNN